MRDPLNPGEITVALRASKDGGAEDFERLYDLVYADLKRLAGYQARKSPDAVTLGATGLVNEAFLRLIRYTDAEWNDRDHFYAVASRAMRNVVVDECRRRLAGKRGGGEFHTDIDGQQLAAVERAEAVLAIDEELDNLRRENVTQADIIECRFFAGYTEEETAQTLGISTRSVQRHWKLAREWLRERLTDGD